MEEQVSDDQVILEEVSYLLSLGFREQDKDLILIGMNVCRDQFSDEDWAHISNETLRWHCQNFYKIGSYIHEETKTNSSNKRSRGKKLRQLDMQRWLCDQGFIQAKEDRV